MYFVIDGWQLMVDMELGLAIIHWNVWEVLAQKKGLFSSSRFIKEGGEGIRNFTILSIGGVKRKEQSLPAKKKKYFF